MRRRRILAALLAALGTAGPAGAEPAVLPAAHEEVTRTIDELAGQIRGLGERWGRHFGRSHGSPGERPLITLMLGWRQELGLTPDQVESLERLRADFQREVIRRDADLRLAEMDLETLLRREPVDLGKVEAKVREIERLRADLRLERIKTIEQGKAQLTPEQRSRLQTLLSAPPPPRLGGPAPQRL
jgi:hypothetical protein